MERNIKKNEETGEANIHLGIQGLPAENICRVCRINPGSNIPSVGHICPNCVFSLRERLKVNIIDGLNSPEQAEIFEEYVASETAYAIAVVSGRNNPELKTKRDVWSKEFAKTLVGSPDRNKCFSLYCLIEAEQIKLLSKSSNEN